MYVAAMGSAFKVGTHLIGGPGYVVNKRDVSVISVYLNNGTYAFTEFTQGRWQYTMSHNDTENRHRWCVGREEDLCT